MQSKLAKIPLPDLTGNPKRCLYITAEIQLHEKRLVHHIDGGMLIRNPKSILQFAAFMHIRKIVDKNRYVVLQFGDENTAGYIERGDTSNRVRHHE